MSWPPNAQRFLFSHLRSFFLVAIPIFSLWQTQQGYGRGPVIAVSSWTCSSTLSYKKAPAPLTALHLTNSKNASFSSHANTLRLSAHHAVKGSLRAILMFLERNGVSKHSIRELQQMVQHQQFIRVLERAEEYVECLIPLLCRGRNTSRNNRHYPLFSLDALLALFTGTWTALGHYAKCLYQEASKDYTRHESKYWEESIVQRGLSVKQQRARQRRRLADWDPQHVEDLKVKLNQMTRFKIDCGKGLVLMTEWSRYLRAQQKHYSSS